MKFNNKGLTLVEIIVSLALVSIVLVFLLNLFTSVRSTYNTSKANADYEMMKSKIVKAVGNDIEQYGLYCIGNAREVIPGNTGYVLIFDRYRDSNNVDPIKKLLQIRKVQIKGKDVNMISYGYDNELSKSLDSRERLTNVTNDIPSSAILEKASFNLSISNTNSDYIELKLPVLSDKGTDYSINIFGVMSKGNLCTQEEMEASEVYRVTFEPNGGSGIVDNTLVKFGRPYGNLPKPIKEGFIFTGWFDEDRLLIDENTIVSKNFDHTLYAQWELKSITVTFDPNGGSVSPTSKTVVANDSYGELEIPTRSGYKFLGWFTEREGGTEVKEDTTIIKNEDHTLFAHWELSNFYVDLDPTGGTVSPTKIAVTINKPYGTLPTPNRTGYKFLGWFDSSSGGNEIKSTTTVSNSIRTLYAHWEKIETSSKATLDHLGLTSVGTCGTSYYAITSDAGICSKVDDYGDSYVFRGTATNNYVKFGKWRNNEPNIYYGYYSIVGNSSFSIFNSLSACNSASKYVGCSTLSRAGKDMYWRIVRINGDGSIRLAYDGTQPYDNGVESVDRMALHQVAYNSSPYDVKTLGYMYAPSGTTNSTSLVQAQTNQESSTIKLALDTWYKNNFFGTKYHNYMGDEIFCNDRMTTAAFNKKYSITIFGYGRYRTMYYPLSRAGHGTSPSAYLKCDSQTRDAFTVNDTEKGNGSLTYPVGTITLDEALLAGSGKYSTSNYAYYLYKGHNYWTMTPYYHDGTISVLYYIRTESVLSMGAGNSSGVVPVINISPEYSLQLKGKGTKVDPFTLE